MHVVKSFLALSTALALAGTVPDLFKALDLIKPKNVIPASPFEVQTPEGRTLRLSDHQGKVILVNFWATWCAPCRDEMPAMQKLYDRHKGDGFVVIALSMDAEGTKVVKPFIREHRLTFPVGLDPKMTIAEKFGVRALPSTFLIDKHGKLLAMALGPREWNSADANALVRSLTTSP